MDLNFHPLLTNYAKGTIDSINFDMDLDKISVAIKSNPLSESAEIIFEDVKAFYYIDNDLSSDFTFSKEHLNVISYDNFGFGEFSTVSPDREDEVFVSIPNFAVNVNDSSLFIDANKIRINNQAFNVK